VIVIIYVLGVFALAWHLLHGFQSAFQTFGLMHKKYTPLIKGIGVFYSIVICLLFALMPISIYLKWFS
jgi:succinate dehydrogenase / fumarate reductase cytochrome b subunit